MFLRFLFGSPVIRCEDTVFQVVEHSFCTYFFLEIMIRFGAFAHKRRALMDVWFLFDSVLVANMVVETWLVPIIIIAAGTDAADVLNISFLRMMRCLAHVAPKDLPPWALLLVDQWFRETLDQKGSGQRASFYFHKYRYVLRYGEATSFVQNIKAALLEVEACERIAAILRFMRFIRSVPELVIILKAVVLFRSVLGRWAALGPDGLSIVGSAQTWKNVEDQRPWALQRDRCWSSSLFGWPNTWKGTTC